MSGAAEVVEVVLLRLLVESPTLAILRRGHGRGPGRDRSARRGDGSQGLRWGGDGAARPMFCVEASMRAGWRW